LTGEDYRDWSDRLRDVEGDGVGSAPARRSGAESVSALAMCVSNSNDTACRRTGNTVDLQLGQPLVELRDAVDQELLRHQSE